MKFFATLLALCVTAYSALAGCTTNTLPAGVYGGTVALAAPAQPTCSYAAAPVQQDGNAALQQLINQALANMVATGPAYSPPAPVTLPVVPVYAPARQVFLAPAPVYLPHRTVFLAAPPVHYGFPAFRAAPVGYAPRGFGGGFGGNFRQANFANGAVGNLLSLAATGAGGFAGATFGGPVGAIFGAVAGKAVGQAITGR